jgi:hypothetical protein
MHTWWPTARGQMARLEEALHRRYDLARAGFVYHVESAMWQRGRRLHLSEEMIDRLEPWASYRRRWMATQPRRPERSQMKREIECWQTGLSADRLFGGHCSL